MHLGYVRCCFHVSRILLPFMYCFISRTPSCWPTCRTVKNPFNLYAVVQILGRMLRAIPGGSQEDNKGVVVGHQLHDLYQFWLKYCAEEHSETAIKRLGKLVEFKVRPAFARPILCCRVVSNGKFLTKPVAQWRLLGSLVALIDRVVGTHP